MIVDESSKNHPVYFRVKKRCDGTSSEKRKKAWQNYKKQKRHRRTNVQMKRLR